MPGLFEPRRRSRKEEGGLPDPAAALDRFERWVERRLPAEPRPPWAAFVLFVVRLAVGRGSWVLGTALIALSAPFWVFPYRQIESMTLAAWYRSTATARAEARIEGLGLRLLPVRGEGGLRAEPYVWLAFEPRPGAPTVRVRYLPHGVGLEDFHQAYVDGDLFSMPREYSSGFRPRWIDPATGEPRVEISYRPEDAEAVEAVAGWNQKTNLVNAENEVDRPLDWFLGDWTRPAADGRVVTVRFSPDRPERVFATDVLSNLPPIGGGPWWPLIGSLIVCVPFGLPFWWVGTRLVGRPLPPRWRHLAVWGPLALLPFWGTRYLAALERLSPGSMEFNPLAAKMSSTQVLPGSEPAAELAGARRVIGLRNSRFAALLARVDLARPAEPLPDHDSVWRELTVRFAAAARGRSDDELESMFHQAWHDFGDLSMSPVLLPVALQVSTDPARGEELRDTARRFLVSIVESSTWPQLCEPAFAARWDDYLPLADHPDPEIAQAARQSIQNHLSWTPERDAAGRPRCAF